MPTENEVYENLGREAVRLLKNREGRSAPDEVRDLTRETMSELDDLIEQYFLNQKGSEQE